MCELINNFPGIFWPILACKEMHQQTCFLRKHISLFLIFVLLIHNRWFGEKKTVYPVTRWRIIYQNHALCATFEHVPEVVPCHMPPTQVVGLRTRNGPLPFIDCLYQHFAQSYTNINIPTSSKRRLAAAPTLLLLLLRFEINFWEVDNVFIITCT